jgi:hypothetical protein
MYSAVYYNPAKTIGGMLEADIYCIMGLGFAAFISLGSMYTYWSIEPHPGWEWLADALVLLWIGVGMSMVAWFKLWIAKPTFNPGETHRNITSLCSSNDAMYSREHDINNSLRRVRLRSCYDGKPCTYGH